MIEISHISTENQEIKIYNEADLNRHWHALTHGQDFYVSVLKLRKIKRSYLEKTRTYLERCTLKNVSIIECSTDPDEITRLLRAINQNLKRQTKDPISLDIRGNAIGKNGVCEVCKLIEGQSIAELSMPEKLGEANTLQIVQTLCAVGIEHIYTKMKSLNIKGSILSEEAFQLLNKIIANRWIINYLDISDCRGKHGFFLRAIDKQTLERSLESNPDLTIMWFQTRASVASEPPADKKKFSRVLKLIFRSALFGHVRRCLKKPRCAHENHTKMNVIEDSCNNMLNPMEDLCETLNCKLSDVHEANCGTQKAKTFEKKEYMVTVEQPKAEYVSFSVYGKRRNAKLCAWKVDEEKYVQKESTRLIDDGFSLVLGSEFRLKANRVQASLAFRKNGEEQISTSSNKQKLVDMDFSSERRYHRVSVTASSTASESNLYDLNYEIGSERGTIAL